MTVFEPGFARRGQKWVARGVGSDHGEGRAVQSAASNERLDSPWPDIIRGGAAASVFFFGLTGWAAVTPLDAAVVARGVVVVAGNRQAVQHLDGGIIRVLKVSEGDKVEQGDVLFELDDTELSSQVSSLGSRLIELEAQRARLEAEGAHERVLAPPERWAQLSVDDQALASVVLSRQASELVARTASVNARITVLARQKQELVARLPGQSEEQAALLEQVRLLDDEIKDLNRLLEKGLAPVARVRALERERVDLLGRVGRIDSEMAQTRESISENDGQVASILAEFGVRRAEELRDVESQISDVSPQYSATQARLRRTLVRAPASGEVVALTAFTEGGVIQPGSHVMDIVPSDRQLVIEVSVEPENGDDIQIDSVAEIKFPGINHRDTSILHGVVTKVSADRMVDPATGAPFFRVEVGIEASEIAKLSSKAGGPRVEVRPGIPAEVLIPLRKRTALQYFYEPFVRSIWGSFREE